MIFQVLARMFSIRAWRRFQRGKYALQICCVPCSHLEPCIRMYTEDHVARAIEDAICKVSGAVIQYLVDGFICELCGGGLP